LKRLVPSSLAGHEGRKPKQQQRALWLKLSTSLTPKYFQLRRGTSTIIYVVGALDSVMNRAKSGMRIDVAIMRPFFIPRPRMKDIVGPLVVKTIVTTILTTVARVAFQAQSAMDCGGLAIMAQSYPEKK
jgi:hypothetical protein